MQSAVLHQGNENINIDIDTNEAVENIAEEIVHFPEKKQFK